MIIKSESFDRKFARDLQYITIFKYPRIIGSHSYKKYGDPVSDIDLSSLVRYDDNLISRLIEMLSTIKNTPFTYLKMDCGIRNEFKLPWTIDANGDSQFEISKVEEWLANFELSNLIPLKKFNSIKQVLYNNDKITISSVLKAQNELEQLGSITWTESDIINTYKVVNGVKYSLLDNIKIFPAVLEFSYLYHDNFIAIELGLMDKNHFKPPTYIYRYYLHEWYRIIKGFRWKIDKTHSSYRKHRSEYDKIIGVKTYDISLLAEIKLYKLLLTYAKAVKNPLFISQLNKFGMIVKSDVKKANLKLDMKIDTVLTSQIDEYFKPYVPIVAQFLTSKDYTAYNINTIRSIDGNTPKTRNEMLTRSSLFSMPMSEFTRVYDIGYRYMIDVLKLMNCVVYASNVHEKMIGEVISSIDLNEYAIRIQNDMIVIYEDGNKEIEREIYTTNTLKSVQKKLLTLKI